LNKDEKKQRYFGARKSLIQEDILVQENTRRYFGTRKSLILEDILVQEV